MNDLLEYAVRVTPGFVLFVAVWVVLRGPALVARIAVLIAGFISLRDAMTPLGFWSFGQSGAGLWVRFADDAALLLVLGATSVLLVGVVHRFAPEQLRKHVQWGRVDVRSVALGLVGAAVVVVPFAVLYRFVPLDERGGPVAVSLLPALLVFALAGNFLEEVLFRGYLQGQLSRTHSPGRTVVASGLFFAAGHVFLASTVTAVGLPLLAFTLLEGLVCAEVARRRGVVASTVAHGVAIFALASGLF